MDDFERNNLLQTLRMSFCQNNSKTFIILRFKNNNNNNKIDKKYKDFHFEHSLQESRKLLSVRGNTDGKKACKGNA